MPVDIAVGLKAAAIELYKARGALFGCNTLATNLGRERCCPTSAYGALA
jgi:hypothetical protein